MGQGNIKWTLLNKNKCFWRSQAVLNIALHWPGLPSPSLHKIPMTALFAWIGFLCPETTHEEPGTGNSYWVLKVFPGYCLRPDRNETTVGNQAEGAKKIICGDLHYCSYFAIKNDQDQRAAACILTCKPSRGDSIPRWEERDGERKSDGKGLFQQENLASSPLMLRSNRCSSWVPCRPAACLYSSWQLPCPSPKLGTLHAFEFCPISSVPDQKVLGA